MSRRCFFLLWESEKWFKVSEQADIVPPDSFLSPDLFIIFSAGSAGGGGDRRGQIDKSPGVRSMKNLLPCMASSDRQCGPPRCRRLFRGVAPSAILCHKAPSRGFGCDELILYGITELLLVDMDLRVMLHQNQLGNKRPPRFVSNNRLALRLVWVLPKLIRNIFFFYCMYYHHFRNVIVFIVFTMYRPSRLIQ